MSHLILHLVAVTPMIIATGYALVCLTAKPRPMAGRHALR